MQFPDRLSGHTLALRPIAAGDLGFLYHVYASTRVDELAPLGWSADEQAAFLTMQFNAQHRYYQEQFPQASFWVIVVDDQPAGRLYLDRRADELRIIDIALLPAYRNQGVGTAYLQAVLAAGTQAGLPVRIHVEQQNRALRLYQRLGFRVIDTNGVYYLMECAPCSTD